MSEIKKFNEFNSGIVSENLTVNDPNVQVVIDMLNEMEVDGETMQYIIEKVGMDDQMLRQLVLSKPKNDVMILLEEGDELERDSFIRKYRQHIEA